MIGQLILMDHELVTGFLGMEWSYGQPKTILAAKLVSSKQKNILTCIETLGHIKQTKWDQTRCWYRILFID